MVFTLIADPADRERGTVTAAFTDAYSVRVTWRWQVVAGLAGVNLGVAQVPDAVSEVWDDRQPEP